MSNISALLVHALVFACVLPLSAVPCIVRSACTLNMDPRGTRVANVESSAGLQLQNAHTPEPDNQAGTIAVTAMS